MHDIGPILLGAAGPFSSSWRDQLGVLPLLVGIFAIFYFLLIRPQQKQRKDRERMLASIKKGDRVVMSGGLHGTIVGLNDHTVVLKVADQVKVEFDRTEVGRIVEVPREKDA